MKTNDDKEKKLSRFDSLWEQFWLWVDVAVQWTAPIRKTKKKNGIFRRR